MRKTDHKIEGIFYKIKIPCAKNLLIIDIVFYKLC